MCENNHGHFWSGEALFIVMALSILEQEKLAWIINYLDQGPASKFLDQRTADEIARIFGNTCGFKCGCPGTLQEGLRDAPLSTLLKIVKCVSDELADAAVEPSILPVQLFEFLVLGGSTVTNTGPTVVNGDLGLSPGTSVTGFPPGTVTGDQHITNAIAAQAQIYLTAAYLDLEARPGGIVIAGNIGGQTLAPGVYKSTSTIAVSSGELTLDAGGNPNAEFIFQAGSTLTLTSGRQIILTGGAQSKNVYWQVGSSATLGTTSVFHGNILALTSISVLTGAQVTGRLLARNGAVTLDTNAVVFPL